MKKKILAAQKELKNNPKLKKQPEKAETDFLRIGGFSLNKQGLLYYLDRAVVPKEIVKEVIRKYFDDPATTGGREHLHERLGRKFIGIGRRAVADFIKSQHVSQLKKPTFLPDLGRGISMGNFPCHIVEIDLVFMEKADKVLNSNYRYICTMLDRFSGKVGACPLRRKDAKLVLDCIQKVLKEWKKDKMAVLASDNGTEFEGSVKMWCKKNNIKRIYTQAYSPLARIERFNRTMRTGLNKFMFMYKTKTWFDVVQAVVKNRNSSVNWDIKVTPTELFKLTDKKEIKLVYDKLVNIRMGNLPSTKGPLNILKKGDKVRKSFKKEKKTLLSKETSKPTWSYGVYRVNKVISTEKGKPRYIISGYPGKL